MIRLIALFGWILILTAPQHSIAQSGPDTTQTIVPLNSNNHLYYIKNTLSAGYHSSPYNGSTFPARTFRVAYLDELLWGGYVTSGATRDLRVGGCSYNAGVQPGVIPDGPLPATYDPARVYRIRRDFATADLREDAADYFGKAPSLVSEEELAILRRQYAHDWETWPTTLGAPFYDTNGNGVRDPEEDPGLLDADMVCWSAVHDLDPVSTTALYGSLPTGMEVQSTWWGYRETGHALANTIFVRYRIIFKGTSSLDARARIDSLYISKFVDADLGSSGNDLFGIDTALQVAYMYNGSEFDSWNASLVPPVVGWQLLQGPLVPAPGNFGYDDLSLRSGVRNLNITSWFPKWTGVPWGDPPFGPSGLTRAFRWMRGYLPDNDNVPPRLFPDENGDPTFLKLAGDPVAHKGDIDGEGTQWSGAPGDRRFLLNTGPFSMTRGDTQHVVYAIIGAAGSDRIRNIEYMRWFAKFVKESWPDPASLRAFAVPEPEPPVRLPSRVTLWSNYPNPFNPETTIRFDLPEATTVRLVVHDVLGRKIRTLVDGERSEGAHAAVWNGRNEAGVSVASGVYIYLLQADGMQATGRMLLAR